MHNQLDRARSRIGSYDALNDARYRTEPHTNHMTSFATHHCSFMRVLCAPKAKWHEGVDILNAQGKPVFAMFDGVARLQEQWNSEGNLVGAGYHISIISQINGKTIRHVYFHLQNAKSALKN